MKQQPFKVTRTCSHLQFLNQFRRTMMATSWRKHKTAKGQRELIKATKHLVSRELEGRCQHAGNGKWLHLPRYDYHPLPTLQARRVVPAFLGQ